MVRASAWAKVNLGLAVTGRRPDGYHELRSVFLRIALGDDLAAETTAPGASDTLVVTGDPDCPVTGNLVLRAASLLRAELAATQPDPRQGPVLPGLAFTLAKRIPMGGGLGGGSADAAAALELGMAAWGVSLRADRRASLAASLGADVPFCASGEAAALVEGIGERLRPLPALLTRVGLLLLTPPVHLATPAVFGAFDALRGSASSASADAVGDLADALAGGLDGPGLAAFGARLRDANDLWPAAAGVARTLAPLRQRAEQHLGVPLLLTGSGATLVALYPSPTAAAAAARMLADDPSDALRGVRITLTSDQPTRAPGEEARA